VSGIEPEYNEEFSRQLLSDAAAQMRVALSRMGMILERIISPEARDKDPQLDANAALFYQSYYRMLRMVNNMTEAASLSDGLPFPRRDQDMAALCRTVCREAEEPGRLLGLTLRFVCAGENLMVALNEEKVRQLLLNLLSNAMKFTPKGGQITVSLKAEGEWVDLTVADTGTGIPEDLLPTLFDRYRHTGRTDPEIHGLGLGLPICHRIMQGHGGELFAASALGRGTAVTARFPNCRCGDMLLRSLPIRYDGGLNPTLLGLCDAVPSKAFSVRYLD